MASSTAGGGVVFVLPWGQSLGGVEVFTARLAPRLAEALPVSLFCYPRPPVATPARYTFPPSVRLVDCDGENWGGVGRNNMARYRAVLPAVLLPNNTVEAYAVAAKLSDDQSGAVRVIGYYHGLSAEVRDTLLRFEPIIHRFVAVSDECADDLLRHLPHRAEDVRTRPCGVPMPHTLNRTYSPPGTPLRVLFAGRLAEREKRVSDLLRVADALTQKAVGFHLRIVGDGPQRDWLAGRLAASSEPVRRAVSLCPPVPIDSMPALFAETDAVLMTSPAEGTSLFLLEAMGWGCVPVVTAVSGTARLIAHVRNGYLAPVGDVDGLAGGLQSLAADRDRLSELGAAAHRAARPYSLDEYEKWFCDLMSETWVTPDRRWPTERPLFPWQASLAYSIGHRLPFLRSIWRRLRSSGAK